MTKYILINWEKDKNPHEKFPRAEEDISFEIKDLKNETIFICDTCFKTFRSRNMLHLEKCRMEWPYEGSKLCKIIQNPSMRIYKIESKNNSVNKRIIKAISHLGEFSKDEQGLGLPISTEGLLKLPWYSLFGFFQHFYFTLFLYKNIISYALLEVYRNIFFKKTNIIIRDIYTFPPHRQKGHAKKLLLEISRQYHKKVGDFLFSEPVSKHLKNTLKSFGLNKIKIITRRNFRTIRIESL